MNIQHAEQGRLDWDTGPVEWAQCSPYSNCLCDHTILVDTALIVHVGQHIDSQAAPTDRVTEYSCAISLDLKSRQPAFHVRLAHVTCAPQANTFEAWILWEQREVNAAFATATVSPYM